MQINADSTTNKLKESELRTKNLTSEVSKMKSEMKFKEKTIETLRNDLEKTEPNAVIVDESSKRLEEIENLIAKKCPNLPKIQGKLYENIEEILQKMSEINDQKKNVYKDKKNLQKTNKDLTKKLENLESQYHSEIEKSSNKVQKLKVEIEDMKYDQQKKKIELMQSEIDKKTISEQLNKANRKVETLEGQIMIHERVITRLSYIGLGQIHGGVYFEKISEHIYMFSM